MNVYYSYHGNNNVMQSIYLGSMQCQCIIQSANKGEGKLYMKFQCNANRNCVWIQIFRALQNKWNDIKNGGSNNENVVVK